MRCPNLPLVVLAIALAAVPATVSVAKTAAEVFSERQVDILAASTGAFAVDGRVFCVGRAKSDPGFGTAVGVGKARAMAMARLSDFIREASPWPADATAEDRALAWALLLSETPLAIDSISAEQIFSDQPGKELYRVVIAFPETAVLTMRPDAGLLASSLDRLRALREEVERERTAQSVVQSAAEEAGTTQPAPPRATSKELHLRLHPPPSVWTPFSKPFLTGPNHADSSRQTGSS